MHERRLRRYATFAPSGETAASSDRRNLRCARGDRCHRSAPTASSRGAPLAPVMIHEEHAVVGRPMAERSGPSRGFATRASTFMAPPIAGIGRCRSTRLSDQSCRVRLRRRLVTKTRGARRRAQTGFRYSPGFRVNRCGCVLPVASTARVSATASSQVANAIHLPSGDQDGDSSSTKRSCPGGAAPRPPGFDDQSRPNASNSVAEPSGEVAGQRANRVVTGPVGAAARRSSGLARSCRRTRPGTESSRRGRSLTVSRRICRLA